jgi:hypothetical protein
VEEHWIVRMKSFDTGCPTQAYRKHKLEVLCQALCGWTWSIRRKNEYNSIEHVALELSECLTEGEVPIEDHVREAQMIL